MNRLIAWFTDNPIAANLLMLLIMIGGFFALPHTDKEFFPTSPLNIVEVSVPYPGAAPVNVEKQICIRVEQAVDGLQGIKSITSTARQNQCDTRIEAEEGYDIQLLLNDVKTRVEAISSLPDDAERPQVRQQNISHDMMNIALEGDVPENTLKRYAQQIKEELEALKHVSTVEISGSRAYEIAVEISQRDLQRYQLTLAEVQLAIRQSSLDVPTGKIKSAQGDILLQLRNQAYDFTDFANIIVRKNADGAVIRLSDIATIKDGFVEDPVISRFNSMPAVFLQVMVTGKPDVLKTNAEVTAYLAEKNPQLPPGMQLIVWHDFSVSFKDRIRTLVSNGASGMVLVFLVLMIFLRPLLALWVTIGIGISFLGAFWVMPLIGVSLNMISLFAFLLILGIVVDDAIIVGESVYNEQQKHGIGMATARSGTQIVSKPVIFAVVSTMLFFVPMLFLPGQSAEAAMAIPSIVLLTLGFSLIESLWILPSHLADMPPEGHFNNRIIRRFDRFRAICSNGLDWFIRKFYQRILNRALRHYGVTICLFTSAMAIVLAIFIGGWMKYGFFPKVSTDYIRVEIQLPKGEPFALSENLTQRIEASARQLQQNITFPGTDISYIENYMVRTTDATVFAAIGLNREKKASISSPEIIRMWREQLGPIPEAEAINFYYEINNKGKPLQYVLASDDNQQLQQASQLLQEYLRTFPGVFDVSDSLQAPRSEMELGLNNASQFAAWDMQTLALQLRSAFYGAEVQRLPRDDEEIRVMLRLGDEERSHHESLGALPVRDTLGNMTRLDAITTIRYTPALQDIQRIDRKRTVIVSADLLSGTTDPLAISDEVVSTFAARLRQQYPKVGVALEGEEEARREFMAAWMSLFFQTLLVIFAMMAIAFRSYWQPVIILTAIPFGIMGAILGHLIMGKEISIFSLLGLMACAGVVVNDNLVLIDRINQLREQGMRLLEAIHQAGIDRFRPIILTSATTFVGLIPIMSETSLQAQFLIPMVISLAYGVLFATVVTLLLVPCLYLMGEQVKAFFGHRLSIFRQKHS